MENVIGIDSFGSKLNNMEKVLIIGGCGYIGSRLYQFLVQQGYDVHSVDLEWFGKFHILANTQEDYKTLDAKYISQFNTIILLAGHSSVKMCEDNLYSSFKNNVSNFVSLLEKIKPEQKFIYASSSGIYGGIGGSQASEETELKYRVSNYYDLSKYVIDSYAKLSKSVQYYGLRFGTVNGYSLNFRDDVMINSMFGANLNSGIIKVTNPKIYRAILGLDDLCNAMLAIIRDGSFDKRGIYNVSSFNLTVEQISRQVADYLSSKIEVGEDRPNAYDFSMSTTLFCDRFSFQFKETVESILYSIARGQAQLTPTNRNKRIMYE